MKSLKRYFLLFAVCLCFCMPAKAFDRSYENSHLSIYTTYKKTGKNLDLLVAVTLKNGWHILYKNPGDTGLPTTFSFSDTDARLLASSVPEKFIYDDVLAQYGFSDKAYYLFRLSNIAENPTLKMTWMACKESCEPEEMTFSLAKQTMPLFTDLREDAKKTFPSVWPQPLFAKVLKNDLVLSSDDGLPEDILYFIPDEKGILSAIDPQTLNEGQLYAPMNDTSKIPSGGLIITKNGAFSAIVYQQKPAMLLLLILAFAGGILLNLMPCVFPVLSLKAIHLAQNSRKKKGRALRALMYILGVVASFLSVAGLLYFFKRGGALLGWGFQLQSPIFVGIMIVLFVLILLYLFNIFKFKTDYTNHLLKVSELNSFFTGFFAVLIASPCTGPFMGALIGYALFESAEIYFPVFIVLGLGYALPFALLELYPSVIKSILPKPGKWMVCLKYILSVPIILTVFWLVWILSHQLMPHRQSDSWETYSQSAVEQSLSSGQAVFIDFTAKWCLSCLLNEQTTLDSKAFLDAAKANNIKLLKADWTNKNDDIFRALKKYNRSSVPLYVFYPQNSRDYMILPQLLTPNTVLSVVNE